jgi:ankyrin repeat protein
VNVRDSFGQTAAHTAARDGHTGALITLTLHGCDLGAVDLNGYTPLHVAAQHGHPEALQLLLRLRPELVDAKDRNGSTSLHWACAQRHTEAVLALLQSHAHVGLI